MRRVPLRRTSTLSRSGRLHVRTRTEKAEKTRRQHGRLRAMLQIARTLGAETPMQITTTRLRKAISDAQLKAKRDASVAYVIARDLTCRCGCGRAIVDVHEEPPRSKGGDPTNPDDCLGLARECHNARHFGTGARRLRIRVGFWARTQIAVVRGRGLLARRCRVEDRGRGGTRYRRAGRCVSEGGSVDYTCSRLPV